MLKMYMGRFVLPTKFPDGAKATLMTHEDRRGITWTLFPVQVSQIISLPSSEPVTQCLLKKEGNTIKNKL